MSDLWTFEVVELRDPTPAVDLTGFDVEASDGHIGKVDEATYETGAGCVVVDTGFWIFGKKRMIPAGVVTDVNHDDETVAVAMTKDQIKSAPDFEDQRSYDERDYDSFGDYYGDYGW
jgi:hypothetical protein